jgi:hypothetical protein
MERPARDKHSSLFGTAVKSFITLTTEVFDSAKACGMSFSKLSLKKSKL